MYDHNIPFPLNGTYVNTKMKDFQPVYMNQWNLSVQRQIGQDWLLSANYLGNNTIHMITTENINPSVYFSNGTNSLHHAERRNRSQALSAAGNARRQRISKRGALLTLLNPAARAVLCGSRADRRWRRRPAMKRLNLSVQKRAQPRRVGVRPITPGRTASAMFTPITRRQPACPVPTIAGSSAATVSGSMCGSCST